MKQKKISLLKSKNKTQRRRRRKICRLLKMYVRRLENLRFHPWMEPEYNELGWTPEDAAIEFSRSTGCDLASATSFFRKIDNKAQADIHGCSKLDWLRYIAPTPRLPKDL